MDLLTEWRAATASAHKQLEAELNLQRPDFSPTDYLKLLHGYYSFYRAYEELLASRAEIPAAKFYRQERTKLENIVSDLKYFDISPQQLDKIPRATLPTHWHESSAVHWGCLYTIEGSMLGGQFLVKHFRQNLKLTGGLSFYEGYGEQARSKWQHFLAHAKSLELSADDFASAVLGASETFKVLGLQLVGALRAT